MTVLIWLVLFALGVFLVGQAFRLDQLERRIGRLERGRR